MPRRNADNLNLTCDLCRLQQINSKFTSMKIHLILAIILFSVPFYSQTSFHLVYKVTNIPEDTNAQHLNTYTKKGNSINDMSSDRDSIVWNRCITLKDQPKYKFDYYRETYLKVPNEQLKKYKIKIFGLDTIASKPCTKISVQAYNNDYKVLLWVPGKGKNYEKYTSGFVQDIDLVKLNLALQDFNLIGFPIRIEYSGDHGQVYDLIAAELFEIDDAYFAVGVTKSMKGQSAEKLKKQGKVTEEQYNAMKEAEEAAKKDAMEQMQKK